MIEICALSAIQNYIIIIIIIDGDKHNLYTLPSLLKK